MQHLRIYQMQHISSSPSSHVSFLPLHLSSDTLFSCDPPSLHLSFIFRFSDTSAFFSGSSLTSLFLHPFFSYFLISPNPHLKSFYSTFILFPKRPCFRHRRTPTIACLSVSFIAQWPTKRHSFIIFQCFICYNAPLLLLAQHIII